MKRVILFLLLIPSVMAACSTCECNRLKSLDYPGQKSYKIDKVFVDMELEDSGRILVNETITFDFYKGRFSFAYRDFKIQKSKIHGLFVTENNHPGCYEQITLPEGVRVKWYYDETENHKRTFTVHYTLTNVLDVYEDYSDFYWKIWGENWDVRVDDVQGELTLPGEVNTNDVYTWGHPRLTGMIGMRDARTVFYKAEDVPPEQWVELRVAFPSGIISSAEHSNLKPGKGLEKILREEKTYGQKGVFWVVAAVISPSLIMATLFVCMYMKSGKERKVEYDAQYEREPPYKYSPAILSSLLNQHNRVPSTKVFGAVILDLVRRGYLALKRVNDDYEIKINNSSEKELSFSEKKVLRILRKFMSCNSITISDFTRKTRRSRLFPMMLTDWKNRVIIEIGSMGLLGNNYNYQKFMFVSTILFFVGVPFLAFPGRITTPLGIGFIAAGILSMLANGIMNEALPRRTKKGALHYKKWMAFKRFLKDFSELRRVGPGSVKLWEEFLVYAIPLGVSRKVEKYMSSIFQEKKKVFGVYAGSFSSFSSSLSSLNRSMHNSSSGGFSGGGGGGCGGGGGGAG